MITTRYIIFTNDSPEYVCNDPVSAAAKLEELAWAKFRQVHWHYKDYEEYRKLCYWHIHEVQGDT